MQADADDFTDPGRRDERPAVVELDPAWDAVARPQRVQRGDDELVAAVLDDLDPGLVGGDIDLVEGVEADPAVEVTRPDQVDLDELPGPPGRGRWVRDPLRCAASRSPASGRGLSEDLCMA